MHEEIAHGLSEEEQAKRSYYRSRRRTFEGSEWMSRYIAGHSKCFAQSSQNEQSSSDHVHEVEPKELFMGQKRLRRLKKIQEQQRK